MLVNKNWIVRQVKTYSEMYTLLRAAQCDTFTQDILKGFLCIENWLPDWAYRGVMSPTDVSRAALEILEIGGGPLQRGPNNSVIAVRSSAHALANPKTSGKC